jgi:hypothetical protein
MVRAVAQIEQEIAALDQTVAAMAQAFYDAYQQYLTALGKAMRQQFVLAGFHICTHAYPEQFLSLSGEQRKELQQALQRLAKQGQTELLDCLAPVQIANAQTDSDQDADQIDTQNNTSPAEDDGIESDEQEDSPDQPVALSEQEGSEQPQPELIQSELGFDAESEGFEFKHELNSEPAFTNQNSDLSASEHSLTINLSDEVSILLVSSQPAAARSELQVSSSNPAEERSLHPKDIAYWQSQLEEAIVEVLQNLSHTTNCVLQQANILPSRLPEPVLEVAAKADLSSEATASPPNLLNLLIEADGEDEKLSMTQVMAMRLRLSEIEFGDAATAAHRSKLRNLTAQLGKLGREYQRKQKERAVAQAEAAWRASWSE